MNAVVRRVYEMCVRILSWMSTHPDDEPGSAVLAAKLESLTARIGETIRAQRQGMLDSRTSRQQKAELRGAMLAVPIAHLARIGALAARDRRELGNAFRFRPAADTYAAFQAAARAMFTEATTHKELLVKHGLSESVLVEFGRQLDEFDAAVKRGLDGRTGHTAATRELAGLTLEVGRLVRAMDARNQFRFRDDRTALEQWVSVRTVLGTPRGPAEPGTPESGTPEAGGEVKPAA
jgi:hypothetical protein